MVPMTMPENGEIGYMDVHGGICDWVGHMDE